MQFNYFLFNNIIIVNNLEINYKYTFYTIRVYIIHANFCIVNINETTSNNASETWNQLYIYFLVSFSCLMMVYYKDFQHRAFHLKFLITRLKQNFPE